MGYNQMLHNLTSQAAIMNTHGIPNDFISNVNPFALIILIPIFDQLVYPLLRKRNINFSPLKRITAGFFAALLAMVWSAVTQAYIYRMSPCKKYANECEGKTAPMSVWIQTGPLGELSPFLSPPQEPAAADGGAGTKSGDVISKLERLDLDSHSGGPPPALDVSPATSRVKSS